MNIPAVHLQPGNVNATLTSTTGRAFPLTFPPGIRGKAHRVIAHLNVRRSPRYRAEAKATFCNIYAHDYCHAMGAYLPRVWWDGKSIDQMLAGQKVTPVYAKTLFEMNANALYQWLLRWGMTYGWQKVDFTEAQTMVNSGAVGVIAAARRDPTKPGHIAVIVPESVEHGMAARAGDTVIAPLQCQAGAVNRDYWTGGGWWEAPNLYTGFGCWYNMPDAMPVSAQNADKAVMHAEDAIAAALKEYVEKFPEHRIKGVTVIDHGAGHGVRFHVDVMVAEA